MYYGTPAIPRTFSDGTSSTIGFATGYQQCPTGGTNPGNLRLYWNNTYAYNQAGTTSTGTGAFFGAVQMSSPAESGNTNVNPNGSYHIFQTQPVPANCDPNVPQSMSIAGMSVGMFDGHIRLVNSSISALTFAQLCQPNDGQVAGQPNNDWDG
jgi:hypothetical protein